MQTQRHKSHEITAEKCSKVPKHSIWSNMAMKHTPSSAMMVKQYGKKMAMFYIHCHCTMFCGVFQIWQLQYGKTPFVSGPACHV